MSTTKQLLIITVLKYKRDYTEFIATNVLFVFNFFSVSKTHKFERKKVMGKSRLATSWPLNPKVLTHCARHSSLCSGSRAQIPSPPHPPPPPQRAISIFMCRETRQTRYQEDDAWGKNLHSKIIQMSGSHIPLRLSL